MTQAQNPYLNSIELAVKRLREGEVIAYPTEAVYGLGCDPFNFSAVEKVFHVKRRPIDKGLILVAASVEQIFDYVELQGMSWEKDVLASWPGPVTWVLPVKEGIPEWISGGRKTLAIRVSAHPMVQELCSQFGKPIVSTSANLTSQPPAKSCDEIVQVFEDQVFCVPGELGNLSKPTRIIDAQSGTVLR
ncbi:L-threonylcarbamoyladenylate synthase [Thiomicrorhabdus sp.]|uniref:L-threonylcarbamoyladenylate synthase n=1 Tax=Thiomicrorhabdus sp. TaxID=2039724 RepID=UPI0029C89884|nr:L-threonylcarbamoyladenylate synthase [Thiomicrorhabdus sp.]